MSDEERGVLERWSRRPKSSVGRIWRAFGLKPWQTDTLKLSEDPQFIDKVRNVVGIYLTPPDKAVVLCVDENTSIQALDRDTAEPADAAQPSRAPHPRLQTS